MVRMPRWTPKLLETLGWLALLPMLGLCLTLWFGYDGRRTVAAEALTPWVLVWAAPLAVAADAHSAISTRTHLARPAGDAAGVERTAHRLPRQPPGGGAQLAAADHRLRQHALQQPHLRGRSSNAPGRQRRRDRVRRVRHHEPLMQWSLQRPKATTRTANELVYRGAGSIGVWSRYPILSGGVIEVDERPTVDVILDVDGSEFLLWAYIRTRPRSRLSRGPSSSMRSATGSKRPHCPPPSSATSTVRAAPVVPRPPRPRGLTDVHEVMGHGWSVSWPMDEGLLPPQFVRIDHALDGDGLTPTAPTTSRYPAATTRASWSRSRSTA